MLCFFLGMSYLGYFTASFLLIPVISWFLGYRNPKVILAATAGFLCFIYVMFILIFSRPLPREIWLNLLGN